MLLAFGFILLNPTGARDGASPLRVAATLGLRLLAILAIALSSKPPRRPWWPRLMYGTLTAWAFLERALVTGLDGPKTYLRQQLAPCPSWDATWFGDDGLVLYGVVGQLSSGICS